MMLKDGTCVSVRPLYLRPRPLLCVSPFARALAALAFSAQVAVAASLLGAGTRALRTRRCARRAVAF